MPPSVIRSNDLLPIPVAQDVHGGVLPRASRHEFDDSISLLMCHALNIPGSNDARGHACGGGAEWPLGVLVPHRCSTALPLQVAYLRSHRLPCRHRDTASAIFFASATSPLHAVRGLGKAMLWRGWSWKLRVVGCLRCLQVARSRCVPWSLRPTFRLAVGSRLMSPRPQ